MSSVKTHRDLDVWKISVDFAIELYRITDKFPAGEKFGLTSQIRRAGVSIPSNIAEGAARYHSKEYLQFLFHALGSVSEIETQLEIAVRLGFLESAQQQMTTLHKIRRMLVGLIGAIRNRQPQKP